MMRGESVFATNGKQWVHTNTPILVMLMFDGPERVCWECGLNRGLFLRLDINGEMVEFEEFCDNE